MQFRQQRRSAALGFAERTVNRMKIPQLKVAGRVDGGSASGTASQTDAIGDETCAINWSATFRWTM